MEVRLYYMYKARVQIKIVVVVVVVLVVWYNWCVCLFSDAEPKCESFRTRRCQTLGSSYQREQLN